MRPAVSQSSRVGYCSAIGFSRVLQPNSLRAADTACVTSVWHDRGIGIPANSPTKRNSGQCTAAAAFVPFRDHYPAPASPLVGPESRSGWRPNEPPTHQCNSSLCMVLLRLTLQWVGRPVCQLLREFTGRGQSCRLGKEPASRRST